MAFDRPLRATRHCRHYSYVLPITLPNSGPHCAAGIDLSGVGMLATPCMPDATASCAKREDYTDAERAAWEKAKEERMARLGAAVQALPKAIPLRTSGVIDCPNCGGRLHYSRWHRGAGIECETEFCCEARFSIEAGKDWPAKRESA